MMEEIDDPEVSRLLQALGLGQRGPDGMLALDSLDQGADTG
jgi:hypothetical protein